jgi:hypothetical protein
MKRVVEPDLDAKQRVDNGVLVLDAVRPGWRSAVKPKDLELSSYVACVLGQIFGSYDEGLAALKLTPIEALNYGFNTFNSQMMVLLIAEWIRRL